MGEAPELGAPAGGEHHRLAFAGHDFGASQQNVRAVQNILVGHRRCGFALRQCFAGDGGGVHAHAEGLQEPAIRGHEVPSADHDHVPGDEFGDGDFQRTAGTPDPGALRQQLSQRGQQSLGTIVLPEGKQAIDDNDRDHRRGEGAHPLAGLRDLADGRHCGGDPQQKREEVREAAEEPSPKRSFGHPFDLVAAEPGEPSIGLCGVETAIAAAKPRQHLLRADCGDVHSSGPSLY